MILIIPTVWVGSFIHPIITPPHPTIIYTFYPSKLTRIKKKTQCYHRQRFLEC